MSPHPAGRRGSRPGVRMIELRPPVTIYDRTLRVDVPLADAVTALECLSCGALLAIGSPNAAHHVDTHRGSAWRRAVRDARIRARTLIETWRNL